MTITPETQHILLNWEETFTLGDHSQDDFCIDLFRGEVRDEDDIPLLFHSVSTLSAIKFLDANSVNLLQRSGDGATLLMEKTPEFQHDAYVWLVAQFKQRNAVDLADEEGLTALSSMIKFGHLEKARVLLENGASVNSYAQINRYGGAKLDIPTQAVNCIVLDQPDQELTAIAGLKLLKEYGWRTTSEQKKDLIERTVHVKPTIHMWLTQNL